MEVKFKLASTLEDVEDIVSICNECFEENTDVEKAKKIFSSTSNDQNQIYLLGYMNGKIVAHTKITIIPTLFEGMETYSILNHVCVHPEYRRHNIATQMLDECTKICLSRHCVAMKLWSMNFRSAAHACYKHYGFKMIEAGFFSKELI